MGAFSQFILRVIMVWNIYSKLLKNLKFFGYWSVYPGWIDMLLIF